MKKNHTILLAGLAIIGIVLWMQHRARSAVTQTRNLAQGFDTSPIDLMFSANPENFTPPTVNVTVTPQLPNTLAEQYVPLFGFVGIAQGQVLP